MYVIVGGEVNLDGGGDSADTFAVSSAIPVSTPLAIQVSKVSRVPRRIIGSVAINRADRDRFVFAAGVEGGVVLRHVEHVAVPESLRHRAPWGVGETTACTKGRVRARRGQARRPWRPAAPTRMAASGRRC